MKTVLYDVVFSVSISVAPSESISSRCRFTMIAPATTMAGNGKFDDQKRNRQRVLARRRLLLKVKGLTKE